MITNDNKINNLFQYWLTATLFLVFSIIIVGGLTRLTNSGLSITQWELFSGILPPLNQEEWETYFNLYKEIPQYTLLNNNMSMDEFKIIFYWEYWHRILARFIGLFFLIPFLYFYFTNSIKKRSKLVDLVIKNKKFKKDIIDKKRIAVILQNIARKSKHKKIDPKITKRIWKSMIRAFIDYEFRNFKKK